MPSAVSRELVHEVLRDSRSTVPDCNAENRSVADSGVKRTFSASPNSAAASARQMSTSSPLKRPLASA
ncbi:Uncharacterised protein [Klebsiella pneumoniae]|nr:Uncharacterised protein [Klebsiella pneumoniae]